MLDALNSIQEVLDRVELQAGSQAEIEGRHRERCRRLYGGRLQPGAKHVIHDSLERTSRRARLGTQARRDIVVKRQGSSLWHIMMLTSAHHDVKGQRTSLRLPPFLARSDARRGGRTGPATTARRRCTRTRRRFWAMTCGGTSGEKLNRVSRVGAANIWSWRPKTRIRCSRTSRSDEAHATRSSTWTIRPERVPWDIDTGSIRGARRSRFSNATSVICPSLVSHRCATAWFTYGPASSGINLGHAHSHGMGFGIRLAARPSRLYSRSMPSARRGLMLSRASRVGMGGCCTARLTRGLSRRLARLPRSGDRAQRTTLSA